MWVKTSVPLFCSCVHREKYLGRTGKVNAEVEENICFKWSLSPEGSNLMAFLLVASRNKGIFFNDQAEVGNSDAAKFSPGQKKTL